MADLENLSVDIDALRRGAEQLARARENVQATFDGFRSAVAGFTGAFGGDDIGGLLAEAHSACVDAATECFSTNISELGSYVDDLRRMAEGFERADDEISASLAKLLGALGD